MLGLRKGSHHPGSPPDDKKLLCMECFSQNSRVYTKGGNMNKKVYVANLPYQATEPELKVLFSKAGDVMSVKIVQDRQTGQPRGIAFVEMSTQWEGRRAVSMLNRTGFHGEKFTGKRGDRKNGASGEDRDRNLKNSDHLDRKEAL